VTRQSERAEESSLRSHPERKRRTSQILTASRCGMTIQ
jgi:hypothetical protein